MASIRQSPRLSRDTLRNIGRYLRGRFTVDTRTLAVYRIITGVLIIADVIARSSRFTEFYTEAGVAPQSMVHDLTGEFRFSFFFLGTGEPFVALLFALHALFGIQLILGYKTRFATIVSFLFVISLDSRNPMALSYADAIFRLLLFWAIFLPLGERWSVDAVHQDRPPRTTVTNLASAAILLQMFYMYFGNALMKVGSDLWRDGTATPLVFGMDHVTWGVAPLLRDQSTLLGIGGWIWFFMLLYVSWLLVLSANRVRMLLVAAFVFVHLSFAATVRIGAFPYVAISGAILFLQSGFWTDAGRLAGRWDWPRLARLRTWLIAVANRFPRLRVSVTLPQRPVRHGHRLAVTLALLAIMVLPGLAFLQTVEIIGLGVKRIEQHTSLATRGFAVYQPPWTIFAPMSEADDRYYVFAARDDAGEEYDVLTNRPLSYERPDVPLHRQYTHYRERFYFENVRHLEDDDAARHLGDYICQTWNGENGSTLQQIDMYFISEVITPETVSDIESRERSADRFHSHVCEGASRATIPGPPF